MTFRKTVKDTKHSRELTARASLHYKETRSMQRVYDKLTRKIYGQK